MCVSKSPPSRSSPTIFGRSPTTGPPCLDPGAPCVPVSVWDGMTRYGLNGLSIDALFVLIGYRAARLVGFRLQARRRLRAFSFACRSTYSLSTSEKQREHGPQQSIEPPTQTSPLCHQSIDTTIDCSDHTNNTNPTTQHCHRGGDSSVRSRSRGVVIIVIIIVQRINGSIHHQLGLIDLSPPPSQDSHAAQPAAAAAATVSAGGNVRPAAPDLDRRPPHDAGAVPYRPGRGQWVTTW